MPVYSDDDLSRFWAKVNKTGDCWLWTAGINNKGYGDFSLQSSSGLKHILAHRLSFTLANGRIPEGLCVLHRCDNPRCVRPDHLFLGTVADNNRDMWAKGRGDRVKRLRGERQGNAKLTEGQVREIRQARAEGLPLLPLAAKFGVDHTLIYRVAAGKVWRHVLV